MIVLLRASSPNACGFGDVERVAAGHSRQEERDRSTYAAARPPVRIVCCMLMIGLVGMSGRRLRSACESESERRGGRLHEESLLNVNELAPAQFMFGSTQLQSSHHHTFCPDSVIDVAPAPTDPDRRCGTL
jgi:hypothetical protein